MITGNFGSAHSGDLSKVEERKRFAYGLGLAGLLPFLACTLLVMLSSPEGSLAKPALNVFMAYSAIILSFLGGIRWGSAISAQDREEDTGAAAGGWTLAMSVLPSLVGLASVFTTPALGLVILLFGFATQGVWDSFSAHTGELPRWMAPLRVLLTIVVVLCHAVVFLSISLA